MGTSVRRVEAVIALFTALLALFWLVPSHAGATVRPLPAGAAHAALGSMDASFSDASRAVPEASGNPNNVVYNSEPVLDAPHVYVLFWLPGGYSFDPPGYTGGTKSFQSVIEQFFADVGGTSYFKVLSQYGEATGQRIQNASIFQNVACPASSCTALVDTTAFPAQSCTSGQNTYSASCCPGLPSGETCVTSDEITTELRNKMAAEGWTEPNPAENLFFVFTPNGVQECDAGFGCTYSSPIGTFSGFFHGYDWQHSPYEYWAYINDRVSCSGSGVNGDCAADDLASVTAHELFEGISDPAGGAWKDASGNEIADKCVGNDAAVALHTHSYTVQSMWSDFNGACEYTLGVANANVSIAKGWNLLSLTSNSTLAGVATSIDASMSNAVEAVAMYGNGRFTLYVPDYTSGSQAIADWQGVFVLSGTAGTWTRATAASSPTVALRPGWNLVAAPGRNPGLISDQITNEVDAAAGDIQSGPNAPAIGDVKEIATYAPGSGYNVYVPTETNITHYPNETLYTLAPGIPVPFTQGMWIDVSTASTWTPA